MANPALNMWTSRTPAPCWKLNRTSFTKTCRKRAMTNPVPYHPFSQCPHVSQNRPSDPRRPKFKKMEPSMRRFSIQIGLGLAFIGVLVYDMSVGLPTSLDSPGSHAFSKPSTRLAEVDEVTKRRTKINKYSPMRLRMEQLINEHQQSIVFALEKLDGKEFQRDEWIRPNGGGGTSCVLQDGNVFEKAGVNTSIVYGTLPRPAIEKMRADHKSLVDSDIENLDFFAAGISLVLHPRNPMAPTVHLNYRYFETQDPRDIVNATGQAPYNWWFGGGTDLTPSYLFEDDAKHFHKTIKTACDSHDKEYYPRFKKWCDEYFRIPHRNESRGVGGIFFDDLDASTRPVAKNPQDDIFRFVTSGLEAFLPSYMPILQRRLDMPFLPEHKTWQQLRRGRYVEFNLVNDRGTSFGLRTPGARVESILMSLPLTARWEYMDPVSGTGVIHSEESQNNGGKELELLEVLKQPRNWA